MATRRCRFRERPYRPDSRPLLRLRSSGPVEQACRRLFHPAGQAPSRRDCLHSDIPPRVVRELRPRRLLQPRHPRRLLTVAEGHSRVSTAVPTTREPSLTARLHADCRRRKNWPILMSGLGRGPSSTCGAVSMVRCESTPIPAAQNASCTASTSTTSARRCCTKAYNVLSVPTSVRRRPGGATAGPTWPRCGGPFPPPARGVVGSSPRPQRDPTCHGREGPRRTAPPRRVGPSTR